MPFPKTNPALERALVARGYEEPTPVQLAVLAPDQGGRDMLVSAQTGSGKTVAFGLAFVSHLLGDAERFDRAAEPLALVVAPTRELALQVQRELAWLYAETGARVISCVGGMDVRTEKNNLANGAHIVVGTPGRLRDHLERGRLDASKLRTVVLDEADEMLDLGFREDLEFILDATPSERQTLLFSATMPRQIAELAKTYQREALRIETIQRNAQHVDIDYRALRVAPNDVEHAVVNVLRFYETRAALVFCSTRDSVRRLHASLSERGFSAVALSGELTQAERTTALQALRNGRSRVLVATDVAARGLDLPDLTLVIHADLPNDRETLLHRSGRTGRAGKKGTCVLIVAHTRRRKAEQLLGAANIRAQWAVPPSAEEIRARDQERLVSNEIFSEAMTEEDLALGRTLLEGRSAEEIAMALIRLNRTTLPAPEDILEGNTSDYKQSNGARGSSFMDRRPDRGGERFKERSSERYGDKGAARKSDGFRAKDTPREPGAVRAPRRDAGLDENQSFERQGDTDDGQMVWFRLNIGKEQNADPRWLLPLICRAGHVTNKEIGAIRINDRDSRFQVHKDHADRFAVAVRTAKSKEANISPARSGDDDTPKVDAPRAEASPKVYTPRPERTERPAKSSSDNGFASRASDPSQRPRGPRQERGPNRDIGVVIPHANRTAEPDATIEGPDGTVMPRPKTESTGFIPRDKGTPPKGGEKSWATKGGDKKPAWDKKPGFDKKTPGGKWAGKPSNNVWAGGSSAEKSGGEKGGYVAPVSGGERDSARPSKPWAGKPSGGKSAWAGKGGAGKPSGGGFKAGGGKPWAGKSGAGKSGAGKSGGGASSASGFKPRAKPGKG
jgi:ATP-dependent RNA helicase DeaD